MFKWHWSLFTSNFLKNYFLYLLVLIFPGGDLNTGRFPSGLNGGARALSRAALFLWASMLLCFSILASFSLALLSTSQVTLANSTFSGFRDSSCWVSLSILSSMWWSMSIVEIFAWNSKVYEKIVSIEFFHQIFSNAWFIDFENPSLEVIQHLIFSTSPCFSRNWKTTDKGFYKNLISNFPEFSMISSILEASFFSQLILSSSCLISASKFSACWFNSVLVLIEIAFPAASLASAFKLYSF